MNNSPAMNNTPSRPPPMSHAAFTGGMDALGGMMAQGQVSDDGEGMKKGELLFKDVGYHGTSEDRATAIAKKGFRYRLRTGKATFGNSFDDDMASVVPGGYVAKEPSQAMSLSHHSRVKAGDHAVAVVSFKPHEAIADEDHAIEHLSHYHAIADHLSGGDRTKRQKYFGPETLGDAEKHLSSYHAGESGNVGSGSYKYAHSAHAELTSFTPEKRKRILDLSRRYYNHEQAPKVYHEGLYHPSHPTGNARMGYKLAMSKEYGGERSWGHGGTAVVPEDAPHMIHGVIHIPRNDGAPTMGRTGKMKANPETHEAFSARTADLRGVLSQHHETPEHAFKAVEALGGKYRVERNPAAAQHAGMAKGIDGMGDMACGYAAAEPMGDGMAKSLGTLAFVFGGVPRER